ncbi:alkaline phosphatase family protein [Pricia sp. S334]|uniref:Alkaline phosphatase family protein n=1 Tax=Pricia mediterranea TaxID=3076079 RepID=A0ABU3L3J3_9FLAO|nr:alkaline phosphatase family protein [Pricia sp. S334]MDT7828321.1 alkaline phosphatase family protein [Pricia sp. S334]
MKIFFATCILFFSSFPLSELQAQTNDNPKVILITLDGFRWQELFSGADSLLITNQKYVSDTTDLKNKYWHGTATKRRQKLMPFVWDWVEKNGQLHGNRRLESKMNLTNTHWFSYPGYNEILTGKADDKRISSNDKIDNPNMTILEKANSTPEYKGKVSAFGSWDVFPYIINEKRSGVPVNAGFEAARGTDLTEKEKFLNRMQTRVPSPWGSVRLDAFTHGYAMEQMKKNHPDLIYIAYGETDDFAHDGNYQAYLESAHRTDGFIEELWQFVQSDPYYNGKTTFIITTDHGRGTNPLETWQHHGDDVKGADEVWVIAFGKGVAAKGEITANEQLYTNQIAASVTKLLNMKTNQDEMGPEFEFLDY